jgi:hypothetical protein
VAPFTIAAAPILPPEGARTIFVVIFPAPIVAVTGTSVAVLTCEAEILKAALAVAAATTTVAGAVI